MLLLKLNDLIKSKKIISRPSKVCKTPYVADIELPDGSIVQAIVHLLVVVVYVKKIVMYMHLQYYQIVLNQNPKYAVIKYICHKYMKKKL